MSFREVRWSARLPIKAMLAAAVALILSRTSLAETRPLPAVREAIRLTGSERQDEFPAIGCDEDGRVWVAWVSHDGEGDELLVQQLGGRGRPVRLSGPKSDCWRPAMGCDGRGRLWVVWAENAKGSWDLCAKFWNGTQWSERVRLTASPESQFLPQLAAAPDGRLWIAWQGAVNGNYEVFAAVVTPEGLRERANVSRHDANDWEPSIAVDSRGALHVAWDSYRNGSYDILLSHRRFATSRGSSDNGVWSAPRVIAGSRDYEAHASLAVDLQDRLWLAWDNGGPHWGQHGQPRLRLHAQRSIDLVCIGPDETLMRPAESPQAVLSGPLKKFCELPRLIVDGHGRLWLVVRHLEDLTPPGMRRVNGKLRPYQARGIWNPYALCYANGRWSQPVKLPESNGRNDMRTALCRDRQGRIWSAWAEDGRRPERAEEPVNHNVHACRLDVSGTRAVSLPVGSPESIPDPAEPLPLARDLRPRYAVTAGGRTYRLWYGDTHRHTDISRCGMNFDGSLMDTYRYALDAAGLDFLAISDHDQDLLKHRYSRDQQGPLQDYAWWRSQKYCDVFHMPGRFLAIYGYEHGGSYAKRGGHKNVLYPRRGMPCLEDDAPEALFHALQSTGAVVIPHQLADGGSATDWGKWNGQFERVAEIFQLRGSYEYFGAPLIAEVQRKGHYLQDALGGGVRIGVIASSDHGLVHGAYAGVYAQEFSREGILTGLRNRNSFGATEMMVLDFRLKDHLMGSEVTVAAPPTFAVHAEGMKELRTVEIVRDGKIVYQATPGTSRCTFEFTDEDPPESGQAYYYLRAQQADDQWAWSSAIWVRMTYD